MTVSNTTGNLWPSTMQFQASADPFRFSPAIHVNQEGYGASFTKKAMIGYYLDILEDAAPFGLLMNFHGATLPRGWVVARCPWHSRTSQRWARGPISSS